MERNADFAGPILITGAGQRIGRYCAERLAEAGFKVIATYRTPRPELTALAQRGVTLLQADFKEIDGIERFIAALHETTPLLRAIIHNASLWLTDAEMEQQLERFDETIRVHLLAPYLISTRCSDLLRRSPAPKKDIIHFTDANIPRGKAAKALYLASKAALENLTLSLASRFAPEIKVNAIAPGLISLRTEVPAERRDAMLKRCALGFDPGPEVVYQTLRYILTNDFLTATVIKLDGGRNIV